MKFKQLFSLTVLVVGTASAKSLPDLSGEYHCTGKDSHDGTYTATITLTLDKNSITKHSAGYKLQTGGGADSSYSGFAVFDGKSMALYFANADATKNDYGVGIGSFTGNKFARFSYNYYEPTYAKTGGNGTEVCNKI